MKKDKTHTINYHLKKIFDDGEIDESTVIRKFRITAADGKSYNTNHYNLSAIIAVGNTETVSIADGELLMEGSDSEPEEGGEGA